MGTKLLIVDDEPFTVDMLETFLQINGYETVGALNGESGLLMAKVEKPELVILDLMLPDIEGYEVCQRIRAYPPTATVPVLVLSARAEPDSKARALAVGADAYMVKPVQFPALLSELTRLIEAKRPAPVVDIQDVDIQIEADSPAPVSPPAAPVLTTPAPNGNGAVHPAPTAPIVTPPANATTPSQPPASNDPKGDTKPLGSSGDKPTPPPDKDDTSKDDTKPKRPDNKP
jgi:CheY-like chemotaxis protein